jgi:hypothetical protein
MDRPIDAECKCPRVHRNPGLRLRRDVSIGSATNDAVIDSYFESSRATHLPESLEGALRQFNR